MKSIYRVRALAVGLLSACVMSLAALAPSGSPAEKTAPVSSPAGHMYLLGENMGMVAVYDGSGGLLRTTDYPVSALPEADRLSLSRGIGVDS